jgi:hypothetical protein
MTFSRRGIGVNPKEALNKDLSLSLDSDRIRLCEAPCGADAALFRDFQRVGKATVEGGKCCADFRETVFSPSKRQRTGIVQNSDVRYEEPSKSGAGRFRTIQISPSAATGRTSDTYGYCASKSTRYG